MAHLDTELCTNQSKLRNISDVNALKDYEVNYRFTNLVYLQLHLGCFM